MSFNITAECGNVIRSLPDAPTCTAAELKRSFDMIPEGIADSVNELIAALEAQTAADKIGSANGTIQSDINALEGKTDDIGDITGTGIPGEDIASQLEYVGVNYLKYRVVETPPEVQESGVLYIVVG